MNYKVKDLGTWQDVPASDHRGEQLISILYDMAGDPIARVTHLRALTYTAWRLGTRDGGYRDELAAQRGAERAIRKHRKGKR